MLLGARNIRNDLAAITKYHKHAPIGNLDMWVPTLNYAARYNLRFALCQSNTQSRWYATPLYSLFLRYIKARMWRPPPPPPRFNSLVRSESRFKRWFDRIPSDFIVYGILALNGVVYLAWQHAEFLFVSLVFSYLHISNSMLIEVTLKEKWWSEVISSHV